MSYPWSVLIPGVGKLVLILLGLWIAIPLAYYLYNFVSLAWGAMLMSIIMP